MIISFGKFIIFFIILIDMVAMTVILCFSFFFWFLSFLAVHQVTYLGFFYFILFYFTLFYYFDESYTPLFLSILAASTPAETYILVRN